VGTRVAPFARMRAIPWGVLGVVITGCAAEPAAIETARAPAGLTAGGLARVATDAGLASLDGDVAVVCPGGGAMGTDAVGDLGCDAAIVDADGAMRRLGREDVVSAVRVDASRLAVIGADRRLVMIDDVGGGERELAARAADVRSAGPGRVVFTELRGDAIDPATTGRIVVLDVARGTRRVVTDHPMDSAPFAVPGSDDVVFVSSRTGLASVWIASPGQRARQVTNVGRSRVDAAFVPVPGRELAWLPGTRTAVFTARYADGPVLWTLDVDTGAAARLGPGRLPRVIGGAVVAIDGDGAGGRVP
jgi:hypothetical protein